MDTGNGGGGGEEREEGDGVDLEAEERRGTVFRILSKASFIFQAWLCESGRSRGRRSVPAFRQRRYEY